MTSCARTLRETKENVWLVYANRRPQRALAIFASRVFYHGYDDETRDASDSPNPPPMLADFSRVPVHRRDPFLRRERRKMAAATV